MLAQTKAAQITARDQADAQIALWQAGGDWGNVMMSRLERRQQRSCDRVIKQIEGKVF